jgi:hypothetical protein
MLKSFIVIGVLFGVAPSVAMAQGNSGNTPASQNANGIPFTANDPPLSSFQGQGPRCRRDLGAVFLLVAPFLPRIKTIVTG